MMAKVGTMTINLEAKVADEPTPAAVVEIDNLRFYLQTLGQVHGGALVARALELLDDVRYEAQRRLREAESNYRSIKAESAARLEYWREETQMRHVAQGHLEAVVVELERRNRRSGAKASPELAKARRCVDQFTAELESQGE